MRSHGLRCIVTTVVCVVAAGTGSSPLPAAAEGPLPPGLILPSAGIPPQSATARTIPPDGTLWDEYYSAPDFSLAVTHHVQTGYADDGDGLISVGDTVELDGVDHAVQDVGDRYFVDFRNRNCDPWPECAGVQRYILEPVQPPDPDDPFNFIYLRVTIYPYDGPLNGIASWIDLNQDRVVDAGDRINLSYDIAYWGDVMYIGTYVGLQDLRVIPVSPTTWSGVKAGHAGQQGGGDE